MKTFIPSLTQRLIWIDQLIHKTSAKYNIGGYVSITGDLNVPVLCRAIEFVLKSQEVYYTKFVNTDTTLTCISDVDFLQFELDVISFAAQANAKEAAVRWMNEDFKVSFNLTENKLFNVKLFEIGPKCHIWYTKIHHIISDGASFTLLLNQVRNTYNALNTGAHFDNVIYSYSEYAFEDSIYLTSERFLEDKKFWAGEFNTLPANLFKIRQEVNQELRCGLKEMTLKIPLPLQRHLQDFASVNKVSFFQLFITLLGVYLSRTQQQEDICIAYPVLNRVKKSFKNTAGVFMNLICMKFNFQGQHTFDDTLLEVKRKMFVGLRHQLFQYGSLVDLLKLHAGNTRLYFVKVSYENFDFESTLGPATVETIALTNHAETDPLSIYIRDYNSNGLDIRFVFDSDFITPEMITSMQNGLLSLMNSIDTLGSRLLSDLPLIDKTELNLILGYSRGAIRDWKYSNMADKWSNAVKSNPDAVALVTNAGQFTYGEIHSASLKICRKLHEICKSEKKMVALRVPRSEFMVIGMLGCIMSNVPYVPISLEEPPERIYAMLSKVGCDILLTSHTIDQRSRLSRIRCEFIDDILLDKESIPPDNYSIQVDADSVCYIMHTSGSTGMPKSISITHRAMCNYVDHFQEYFELTRHDYVLQQSSISFDTSVEEIFPILASGGRLYILDDRKNINLLREIIVSEGITLLSATPLVLNYLNGMPVGDSLRIMISGGEVLHPDQINSFLDRGISVYNTYGPTETTVCVSYYKVEKPTGHVIPIGTPISNVNIYILDKFGRIQPQGVEGEIHIGGASVAVNLAGDNLLVASVLTDSIHGKDVLYRTGDLGELSNGTFYFTGRKDKQVKVRGNRIEPFEIEQVMLKYQNVKSAIVVSVTQNGDTALVAFVVLSNPKHEQELNKFLVERLPDYMVPQKLILIDEIPLTDRGKPDVKLLESKLQAWTDDDSKIFFVPESSHETMLHKIWMDILKRDKISTTDNFFLLGGHSITANMLVVRIYEECSLRITLGDVFNYPTIRELASHLTAFEQDNFDVIELE